VTRHDNDSTAAIDSAAKPSEDGDILDRTSPLVALGLAPRASRPPPWCRPTRTVPASRRTRQQWLEFDTHPRGTSSSTNAQRGSNGRRDQHASEIRQARGDLTQFARRQTSVRSSQCDDIQTAIHRQIAGFGAGDTSASVARRRCSIIGGAFVPPCQRRRFVAQRVLGPPDCRQIRCRPQEKHGVGVLGRHETAPGESPGAVSLSSGDRIRTCDLWFMS
jgi:hypothetical protein